MQDASHLESFVEMLRRLREPHLIVSRSGRVLAANLSAAESFGTSVAALEGATLDGYATDPEGLREWLDRRLADDPFPLRARDGRRFVCEADLLAPDIVLLRISGGPEAAPRTRVFLEALVRLRGTSTAAAVAQALEDLSRALLTHGLTCLGAISAGIFLLDETGSHLELKGSVGYADDMLDRFRLVPLTAAMPLTDAVKLRAPVFVGTSEEYAAGYADFALAHPELGETRAVACMPLDVGSGTMGAIAFAFPQPWSFGESDRNALQVFARQCAEVFAWAQRAASDPSARDAGERAASRLERLHAFNRTLAKAITPAHVAEAVVDMGMAATSANVGGLWLLADDGATVSLVRSVGRTGPRPEDYASVPLEPPGRMPIIDAIRTGTAVWIESCRQMEDQYPESFRAFSHGRETSLACLPLFAQGRCIGGLVYNFEGTRRFVEDERAFLQLLSWHSAQAIERSRLYAAERRAREAAERNQRRSDFLAQAGTMLASSLDYPSTLAGIAGVAVPRFADWCVVNLTALDARTDPPVGAHVDPEKQPLVVELATRLRALFARDGEVQSVAHTGQPRLRRTANVQIMREWLRGDPELSELFEKIGITSSMVVPVSARGKRLGIIVLGSASPSRLYDENDLAMAEELGRRAGLAIDSARLYRDAREADRQKDDFLAMLSHELRNPLAPIVTALEMMTLRGGDAFAKERTIIARHVRHVVRLVDDLLDVARITRRKIELRRAPCEIASVVAKAVEMAAPLVQERSHHLLVSVPANGLTVFADAARVAQAVTNLLANAAKYTEPGGEIAVEARAEGTDAVIRVHDSGIGIAPEMLPHIFDLFVQERMALDRAQGGLGIGLTVVKSLVDLHGGSISAHSEGRWKGSEFVIRLPLAAAAQVPDVAPPRAVTAPEAPEHLEERLRVLVVDDNGDAADMLGEALGVLGCTVQIAHDGPAAVAAASDFSPDLALVDIGLPIMNGYELVARLRGLTFAPKRIVAVTGYGQETDRRRSREAGFDEHLVKPIDFETLRGVVTRSWPP